MKICSILVPTSTSSCRNGADPTSTDMMGRASSTPATATGTSPSSIQVSNAEVIRRTSGAPVASAAGRDSTGTTRLASAPPATISYTTLGTVLAVV